MKNISLIIILLLSFTVANAQKNNSKSEIDNTKVITVKEAETTTQDNKTEIKVTSANKKRALDTLIINCINHKDNLFKLEVKRNIC